MNDLEAIAELAADDPLPQLADMSAARARLDAAIATELTGAPAVLTQGVLRHPGTAVRLQRRLIMRRRRWRSSSARRLPSR